MEYNSPWIINKIIGKKNLQKIDGQNWMPIWIIKNDYSPTRRISLNS